jgi:GxxExxY protein
MGKFLYKDETHRIIGACFEVYNEKGCGFLEAVYQECLCLMNSAHRSHELNQSRRL